MMFDHDDEKEKEKDDKELGDEALDGVLDGDEGFDEDGEEADPLMAGDEPSEAEEGRDWA